MEPESSLPCSQEPAFGPYPELDDLESTSSHTISLRSLSSHVVLRTGSRLVSPLPAFQVKCGYTCYPPMRTSHPTNLILLDLVPE
jgi:hypothetical protein